MSRKAQALRAAARPPDQSSGIEAPNGDPSQTTTSDGAQRQAVATDARIRTSWEHMEEIVQILKTAFPLLVLTLETMVEQILLKFKPSVEEEIYRHICMLLGEALQVCLSDC